MWLLFMDFVLLLVVLAVFWILKTKDQQRRITLLARHLSQYSIEKLMETVSQGYARALGEGSPERQTQVWTYLNSSEQSLSEQLLRLATEFAKLEAAQTRVSQLGIAIPFADTLFPRATFDLRRALSVHAQGIADAVNNSGQQPPKDRAHTLLAELYLLQHTCHWFCRSKTVASARLLARHQTSYAQALAAVAPQTRRAYESLVKG